MRFTVVAEALQREDAKPYELGQSDCFVRGLRVADVVRGTNLVGRYAGRYSSYRGGKRVMLNDGFKSLAQLLKSHLLSKAPLQAQIGDLGIIMLEQDGKAAEHVGICEGAQWSVKTPNGIDRYPLDQARVAFQV